jgi:AcrR family transcriptional regulator
MASARRHHLEDSSTSSALLDATEQIMLEEGYAAVSSRRVASRAGVTAALVHYYFGTMDELLTAVFRRIAERSLERQARVLSSSQPLWGLWDSTRDQFHTALLMEFNALANHQKSVRHLPLPHDGESLRYRHRPRRNRRSHRTSHPRARR